MAIYFGNYTPRKRKYSNISRNVGHSMNTQRSESSSQHLSGYGIRGQIIDGILVKVQFIMCSLDP